MTSSHVSEAIVQKKPCHTTELSIQIKRRLIILTKDIFVTIRNNNVDIFMDITLCFTLVCSFNDIVFHDKKTNVSAVMPFMKAVRIKNSQQIRKYISISFLLQTKNREQAKRNIFNNDY